ncbi:MAG: hypothetical protein A3K06_01030 [Candidatus Doudnabacteria bacterium RIFCSPHIGHO2_01_52_17]|uniref:Uncharacterized protein n=1 Tax=Candidatus Doudnabacteria bacterium RIFCSPHIGHO2_01_52_17 TaxID=1817820 RepID=A0A1F5NEC6_9BACT|nr:MAG: hypothetical protein A3K06_01030 [Candidatus Doudnabacteria bacterium RIFCSPHIGHO2_01_52_17]
MITKIIGKLRFYFAIFLLRLAVTINNAALAASVMAWVAWRAVPESPLPAGRTWPRVLCIGRTIFVDDVKAMAKYSGQIEYVVVHLQYFDQIFRHFFTQETRGLVGENNYHLSPPDLEGKVRYAEFLRRLLPHLRLKFGIQAVLSGNFNYSIQQELCRVSEYWGIPFIVLHKEGMDIFRDSIASLYGTQRFTGRKALFYNERIRKDFLQIKLPGLTEDNSVAVGIPRLDSYFVRRYEPPQKKQITLFTIDPSSYFTYLMNDKQKFAAIGERTGEYYRVVMEFALRHPEFRVVIKTKAAKHYADQVNAIREKHFPNQPMPNLVITNSASPSVLIRDSQAIISYNSTTLIEAMLTGRPVITLDFRDLIPGPQWDYFGNHQELANYVRTLPDLENLLLHPEKPARPGEAEKAAFLRELIYIPDGRASQRAEAAILQTIKR